MALVTEYVANVRLKKALSILSRHDPKIRILDVGCGNCYILESIRDAGYNITGIDIDTPETCPWMPHYPDYVMDARTMSFKNSSFDVVICFEVVEHVDCLNEIRRVLRTGGIFICSTPTKGSDWVRHLLIKLHLLQDQDFGKGHEFYVNLNQLRGFNTLSYTKLFLGTSQFGVFEKC